MLTTRVSTLLLFALAAVLCEASNTADDKNLTTTDMIIDEARVTIPLTAIPINVTKSLVQLKYSVVADSPTAESDGSSEG